MFKILFISLLTIASFAFCKVLECDSIVACNQKTGVAPTKAKETYFCDEPVNVLCGAAIWQSYVQKPDASKVLLLGAELRQEKPEGLNTRFLLAGMKKSNANHYLISAEGSYKYTMRATISIYPTCMLTWARFGSKPIFNEDSVYIWTNRLHVGLGIEETFQNFLLLGVKGYLIRELDNRTFGEFSKMFMGTNNPKSIAYRVCPYFHLCTFGKGVIEIEPYYGKCFKDLMEETGCKISYSMAI